MAAPTFRSASTATGTGTSLTPTEPAGAANGDLLVAIAYVESNSATFTPPSGWSSTFAGSVTVDSGVMSDGPWEAHAYWIRRGASAPALTFTFGVSAYGEVYVYAYSGAVSSGDPFSFATSAVRNDTTAKTFPDISGTTLTADELLLWYGASFGMSTPNVPTAPGTWADRGGTGDIIGADQAQAVAGATGTVTGGISNQGTNQATASFLLGLKSTAGSGTALTGKASASSSAKGTLTLSTALTGKAPGSSSAKADYLYRGTGGRLLLEDGTSLLLLEDGASRLLLEDPGPPAAGGVALTGKAAASSSAKGTLTLATALTGKASASGSAKATLTVAGGGLTGKASAASSAKGTIAISPPYDDFTGSAIDANQWTVYNRLGDQVNAEVNAVIPANVRVSAGTLKIDSKFEDVVAGDTTTGAPNPRTVHYSSGQIAQSGVPFLYGTVDVRAKLPAAAGGAWPCIWMLGYLWQPSQPFTANDPANNWPVGGWWEIDIAEFLGGHRTQVNNALHFITANRTGSGEKALGFDASTQFAVYRLVWTPTSLTWYVDAEGGAGFVQTLQITGTPGTDIPNTPGYLIIHTAIGGPGGTPVSTDYPITFEVDYARVTLAPGQLTGKAGEASSAKGTLSLATALTGKAAAASSAKATLSVAKPLTAKAGEASSAKATLTVATALTGKAGASASAKATLALATALAGKAPAASSARATLTLATALAGKAAASSSAKGTLSVAGSFTGKASAASSAKGTLTLATTLTGRAGASASAKGALGTGAALTGRAAASASARGTLSLATAMLGKASASASATASLSVAGGAVQLGGKASATSSARGALSVAKPLTGRVGAAGSARGTLFVLGAFSGRAGNASSARAALGVLKPLTGRAANASKARGIIHRRRRLVASSAGVTVRGSSSSVRTRNQASGQLRRDA